MFDFDYSVMAQSTDEYLLKPYYAEEVYSADFFTGFFNRKNAEEERRRNIGSLLKNAALAAGVLGSVGLGAYGLHKSHVYGNKIKEIVEKYEDQMEKFRILVNKEEL